MPSRPKCERCGSEDVVPGRVRGHSLGFVPDGAPALGGVNSNSPIAAELCMKCGDLRLRGDVRWVGKVLGRFVPGQP